MSQFMKTICICFKCLTFYNLFGKAFRGELVSQDLNDEPAEKLLERIMEEKAKMEAELKGTKKKAKRFKKKLHVQKQMPIPILFEGLEFEEGFRADLVVENKVIIELKSVEKVLNIHKKQLLTYLKLSKMKLGYLINFNEELLKNGIKRIINGKL
jgi:GxxExxY protein